MVFVLFIINVCRECAFAYLDLSAEVWMNFRQAMLWLLSMKMVIKFITFIFFVFFADNRSSSRNCPPKNLHDDVKSTGFASTKVNISSY